MKFKLFLAAALYSAFPSTTMATELPVTIAFDSETGAQETYLGAIYYTGGLAERSTLNLPQATDLAFIRFQIPDFCKPEIFEAGTVTEGVSDLAQATSTPNVFAVNGGRGTRARAVFASMNGPEGISCHVLVFARTQSEQPSPPQPDSPKGVSCIINEVNAQIATQVITDGLAFNFIVPALRTIMLVTNLRPDRSMPTVDFAFDRDMSPGYFPVRLALDPQVQERPDCGTAPLYALRQVGFSSFLEFVRVR